MPFLQKVAMGVVLIGVFTTLTLPKRQTIGVIDAGRKFTMGVLGTAMGTAKPV